MAACARDIVIPRFGRNVGHEKSMHFIGQVDIELAISIDTLPFWPAPLSFCRSFSAELSGFKLSLYSFSDNTVLDISWSFSCCLVFGFPGRDTEAQQVIYGK